MNQFRGFRESSQFNGGVWSRTVTSFKLTKAQVSFNCVGFSRLGVITQVRALTRASSRPRSSAAEAKR